MSEKKSDVFRVAAVGDIHFGEHDTGRYQDIFKNLATEADALVLCGDLTQNGSVKEAEVLAGELKYCHVPVLGVLGNHDYDKDEDDKIREVLRLVMTFLDEELYVIEDVGFVGTKGFGGGFNEHALSAFGGNGIKAFVREALDETLRLENALSRLDTPKKVVALHYAPIPETVEGEPKEIFPFLGSSRLAEPINTYGADIVFHGHAHRGTSKGETIKGIPVHNVALPMIENPEKPYIIFDI